MPYTSRLPRMIGRLEGTTRAALTRGAVRVRNGAREKVPRESGRLHDSIHVRQEPEGVYVVAGNDEVFYGHIVEHGGVRTPPRPFLVPALDENRDQIITDVAVAVREIT